MKKKYCTNICFSLFLFSTFLHTLGKSHFYVQSVQFKKNMTTCNKFCKTWTPTRINAKVCFGCTFVRFRGLLTCTAQKYRVQYLFIYIFFEPNKKKATETLVYECRIFRLCFFSCFYLNNKLILTQKYHYIYSL